jgi:hypothetical protein
MEEVLERITSPREGERWKRGVSGLTKSPYFVLVNMEDEVAGHQARIFQQKY